MVGFIIENIMKKIQIVRSNRRTIAVEIKRDLSVIVWAPIGMSQVRINQFLQDKSKWIQKHLEIVKNRVAKSRDDYIVKFTENGLKNLKRQAKLIIPNKVAEIAERTELTYNKISFRFQKSRWGSCSAKGNLSFNCLLVLCTEEIMEYVIIHELCHLRYMNHSKEFWLMVSRFCPNYKICNNWLKIEGNKLIGKL